MYFIILQYLEICYINQNVFDQIVTVYRYLFYLSLLLYQNGFPLSGCGCIRLYLIRLSQYLSLTVTVSERVSSLSGCGCIRLYLIRLSQYIDICFISHCYCIRTGFLSVRLWLYQVVFDQIVTVYRYLFSLLLYQNGFPLCQVVAVSQYIDICFISHCYCIRKGFLSVRLWLYQVVFDQIVTVYRYLFSLLLYQNVFPLCQVVAVSGCI